MFHKKYNDRKISEVLSEFIQKNKRIQIHHELKLIQDAWKSEMGDMINGYTSKFFYQAWQIGNHPYFRTSESRTKYVKTKGHQTTK